MSRFLHPLLLLVARATDSELGRTVEYLKAENRILRDKLPQRIQVTPAERARLVKLGRRLGPAIKELITIVSPRTFARWASGNTSKQRPRRPGRPRKPEEFRQLIVRIAHETDWGYRRIWGELKKLGIHSVSRSTVTGWHNKPETSSNSSRIRMTNIRHTSFVTGTVNSRSSSARS